MADQVAGMVPGCMVGRCEQRVGRCGNVFAVKGVDERHGRLGRWDSARTCVWVCGEVWGRVGMCGQMGASTRRHMADQEAETVNGSMV